MDTWNECTEKTGGYSFDVFFVCFQFVCGTMINKKEGVENE